MGESSGQLCVGFPARGSEKFGCILALGFRNYDLYHAVTEKTCPGRRGDPRVAHTIVWDNEMACRCTQCTFVSLPTPNPVLGFAWYIDTAGRLKFTTGPYDRVLHGPFGANTQRDLEERMETFRRGWIDWHGPGPWYVRHDRASNNPRHPSIVLSQSSLYQRSDTTDIEDTGPFTSLESAQREARQKMVTKK